VSQLSSIYLHFRVSIEGKGTLILIDDRIGSKHYADIIPGSVITRLDSADLAFDAGDLTVGVEVKKTLDAVNCLFSGRLADHQIPLMKASYDVVYLVIEGVYRPCPQSGVLQVLKLFNENEKGIQAGRWSDATSGRQRLLFSSFESWLNTLAVQGGILVRNTSSVAGTAALVLSMQSWWQKSEHRSYHVMDETLPETVLSRPTMLRRIVALLPRVGWSRSAILAKRFQSVAELTEASPEAFLIENEIAMPTAIKIWEALHGENS